jgi:hypothetical protein
MSESSVLVIAHPGHELRAFTLLRRLQPKVAVLTDGSGSQGVSRVARTQRILRENGCQDGCWMGEISDPAIYEMILQGDAAPFMEWTIRLATMLRQDSARLVVGDALEGFNPSHDLCRFMIDAAIELAERETGHQIENREFLLEGPPGIVPLGREEGVLILTLDDSDFAAKKAAAETYEELRGEMERALARFGEAPFRSEVYQTVSRRGPLEEMFPEAPFYERFGERRVREGVFRSLIRFHGHVRPLVERLRTGLELSNS